MSEISNCPKCKMGNTYIDGMMNVCPDCGNEWSDNVEEESSKVSRDSNGSPLQDGDAVTVIKDLKVRGSSMVVKRGTKIKYVKLTDNTEEIDCKVDGISVVLKTCFLKK